MASRIRIAAGSSAPLSTGRQVIIRSRHEAVLEDVCGNRVDRAFEVDLLKPAEPIKPQALDIPFVVGR